MSWLQKLRNIFASPQSIAARHGALGEAQAQRFLKRKCGYRILAKNWRHGKGELDIVARDKETLVFVEVKARSQDAKVPGYNAVNAHKKRLLEQTARAYIASLRKKPQHIRFDIVELRLENMGKPRLNHYRNVPLFPKNFLG